MNKLKLIKVLGIIAIVFSACKTIRDEVESTNSDNQDIQNTTASKSGAAFSAIEVHYINEEGKEVKITEEEFKRFVVNSHEAIPSGSEVSNIEVVLDDEEHPVILAEISGIGQYANFISQHSTKSNSYALAKVCFCTVKNCDGCELAINAGLCSCSPCDNSTGVCLKTSSMTTDGSYSKELFE